MVTINSKRLRLAAYGFDERSEQGFRMAFKGAGQGKALLVDEGSAEFGIINLDAPNSRGLLDEYAKRYPGKPAIKFSVKPSENSDALHVKKPATIDDMLAAIDNLAIEIEKHAKVAIDTKPLSDSQKVETKPIPKKVNLKKKTGLYYNPKDYLQGEIHSAMEYAKTRELAVELWLLNDDADWKKIIILPGIKKVLTSVDNKQLRTFCSLPTSLINSRLYKRNEKETNIIQDKIEKEGRGISFDAFLWKVALCTSQGRLPLGTKLEDTAYLTHWPNLTRLYPVVGSMRMTTLMVNQPRSLPLIAKVLKIPLGRVFAFYSAAYAIGIASGNANVIEADSQCMPQRHRDHSLLGSILKRLKKNTDPDIEAFA